MTFRAFSVFRLFAPFSAVAQTGSRSAPGFELFHVRKADDSGFEPFQVRKPDDSGWEDFRVRTNG